jgi:hypothetical protein
MKQVDCERQLGPSQPTSSGKVWLLQFARDAQAYLQTDVGQRERTKKSWLPFLEVRGTPPPPQAGPSAMLPQVLMSLHLVREEMKLDTLSTESTGDFEQTLTPVLAQLAHWLGYAGWADHYMLEDDAMESCQFDAGMGFPRHVVACNY